jgi:hypothetical protein
MELKDKIKIALSEVYGEFKTGLEIQYEARLTETLLTGDTRNREEWVTYNQVMIELKHNLKDMLRVRQLQYELTDDSRPNEVCLGIIKDLGVKTTELDRLYYKIMNF